MRYISTYEFKHEVWSYILVLLYGLLNDAVLPGISLGAIAGIIVAAIFGATIFAVCLYFVFYRSKQIEEESFLQGSSDEHFNEHLRK